MTELGCVLARMTDTVAVPATITASFISEVFRLGSSGDIRLVVDTTRLQHPLGAGVVKSFAYDLHMATRQLTGNVGSGDVNSIAVLYADRYGPFTDALGVMFDRGFVTDDDPGGPSFKAVPREACAIFLGAIAALRDSDVDRKREAQFSTIHEMGHVFNLQHATSGPNYLAVSPAQRAFGVNEAFHFTDAHKKLLASCSTNPSVRPGGSRFGDTSASGSDNRPPRRAAKLPEVRIEMNRDAFFFWEPVELDVEVRAPSGVKSMRIPDEIDPGYSTLSIWIEEPSGERRRYRSPRQYCTRKLMRPIGSKSPFRRDISVFGESGGYTFRRPGTHRLWVELRLDRGRSIRSNDWEVDVRSPSRARTKDLEAGRVLTRLASRVLLYHRVERFRGRATRDLVSLATEYPRAGFAPAVHYAVGRALLATSADAAAPSRRGRLARLARSHLERSADARDLGTHARMRATHLLRTT